MVVCASVETTEISASSPQPIIKEDNLGTKVVDVSNKKVSGSTLVVGLDGLSLSLSAAKSGRPATPPNLSVLESEDAPEMVPRRKYVAFILELPTLRLLRQVRWSAGGVTLCAAAVQNHSFAWTACR